MCSINFNSVTKLTFTTAISKGYIYSSMWKFLLITKQHFNDKFININSTKAILFAVLIKLNLTIIDGSPKTLGLVSVLQ